VTWTETGTTLYYSAYLLDSAVAHDTLSIQEHEIRRGHKCNSSGFSSMDSNSRTGRVKPWIDEHLLKPFLSRSKERSSSRSRSVTPSRNALSANDPLSTHQNLPSTLLQSSDDSSVCVVTTSSARPSLLPSSEQLTSTLKTTLNFLKDALNGVPLPGKGAIDVAIRIIEIAQVSGSSSLIPVCSYNQSYIDGEG